MSDRMELIARFKQIESDLQDAAQFNRPVCPLLAGDLIGLAEQLHCTEAAERFLDELRTRNEQPPGPFSGVTGWDS